MSCFYKRSTDPVVPHLLNAEPVEMVFVLIIVHAVRRPSENEEDVHPSVLLKGFPDNFLFCLVILRYFLNLLYGV